MEKQTFIERNKVFLLGLAASIAVALQQFLGTTEINWRVIGYAAGMAGLSFLANQWRGQGVTILGILGTLAGTFVAIHNTGTFTWNQFILSSVAAILAAVAPPAKQVEYEKSPTIVEAKQEGEVIKAEQKAEDKK